MPSRFRSRRCGSQRLRRLGLHASALSRHDQLGALGRSATLPRGTACAAASPSCCVRAPTRASTSTAALDSPQSPALASSGSPVSGLAGAVYLEPLGPSTTEPRRAGTGHSVRRAPDHPQGGAPHRGNSRDRHAAVRGLAPSLATPAPLRVRNRDQNDGRPRGYVGKVGLTRINLRALTHRVELPGTTKSSW